jgi:hypothetical protein
MPPILYVTLDLNDTGFTDAELEGFFEIEMSFDKYLIADAVPPGFSSRNANHTRTPVLAFSGFPGEDTLIGLSSFESAVRSEIANALIDYSKAVDEWREETEKNRLKFEFEGKLYTVPPTLDLKTESGVSYFYTPVAVEALNALKSKFLGRSIDPVSEEEKNAIIKEVRDNNEASRFARLNAKEVEYRRSENANLISIIRAREERIEQLEKGIKERDDDLIAIKAIIEANGF